jgi:hypothetical protein
MSDKRRGNKRAQAFTFQALRRAARACPPDRTMKIDLKSGILEMIPREKSDSTFTTQSSNAGETAHEHASK